MLTKLEMFFAGQFGGDSLYWVLVGLFGNISVWLVPFRSFVKQLVTIPVMVLVLLVLFNGFQFWVRGSSLPGSLVVKVFDWYLAGVQSVDSVCHWFCSVDSLCHWFLAGFCGGDSTGSSPGGAETACPADWGSRRPPSPPSHYPGSPTQLPGTLILTRSH